MEVMKLLHSKTLSKQGFTLTGKLIKKILTELTGTFTDVHRFVNTDVWRDECEYLTSYNAFGQADRFIFAAFSETHHHYWGKLMSSKEAEVSLYQLCNHFLIARPNLD